VDTRYEDAATTLGAGQWMVFWRVTMPSIVPALGAGAVLAWARALGEFGATITFAGNAPGATQTVPLAVFVELQRGLDGAIALSLVLVAVSLAIIVAMRERLVAGL
jgi:molybdate transport system permease protein